MPEDVSGLPNVEGLEGFVSLTDDSTADKGTGASTAAQPNQNQTTQPNQQTKPPASDPQELDLGQFKNPKDLLKSYKEIQGAFTRMAQERKSTQEELARLREQVELSQFRPPPVHQQPQQQATDFDTQFINSPKAAVEGVAGEQAFKIYQRTRIAEVLEDERLKNPGEYQERLNYANIISQQYPQLIGSPAGMKRLFKMADDYRTKDYQDKGAKFVRALVGDDIDIERFKSMLKKDGQPQAQTQNNNAYMPDTTSSRTGTETDTRATGNEAEIQDAVKKGDPDGVIAALFKRQGLR